MNTPPKDSLFLADIGLPHYVVAHWSRSMNYYVYAESQVNLYHGKWSDIYFKTDSFGESELKDWMELPTCLKSAPTTLGEIIL